MSAARSACRINGKEGSQENAATAAHGAESARIVKAGSASTEVIENAGIEVSAVSVAIEASDGPRSWRGRTAMRASGHIWAN